MLIVRAAVGCREMIPPFQGPSPGRAVSVQRDLESPRRPGLIIWAGGLSVMRAASQVVSPRKAQISVRTQRPTASRQQPEAHSLLAVQGARLPSSAGAGSGHAPQSMAVPQLSTAGPQTTPSSAQLSGVQTSSGHAPQSSGLPQPSSACCPHPSASQLAGTQSGPSDSVSAVVITPVRPLTHVLTSSSHTPLQQSSGALHGPLPLGKHAAVVVVGAAVVVVVGTQAKTFGSHVSPLQHPPESKQKPFSGVQH
jgi:hypothetical protein